MSEEDNTDPGMVAAGVIMFILFLYTLYTGETEFTVASTSVIVASGLINKYLNLRFGD